MYPLHGQFYHKPRAKSIDDGKNEECADICARGRRRDGQRCPEALLKVQDGAYLPRRLYQSKGGSIGSNLKRLFYCAELLCLRGREKVWDFFLAEQEIKALPLGETKKERTKQLPKFLLPTFLFKEKYGFFSKKSRAAYYVVSGEVRNI